MSHVQHELAQKFPEKTDRIHALKTGDAHFSRLFDEYHDLNRHIHRIESRGTDRSREMMKELKLQRITLLDKLTAMLNT
ncbi:MAG: hypothetical protein COA84_00810 [Robiginitomaculum sp.]|nr:MAG: hypothetical protein COA84_00810 [Robiginitomaculum sp.]